MNKGYFVSLPKPQSYMWRVINFKYFELALVNHCRAGGGLFLGLKYHFPASIFDVEAYSNNNAYTKTSLGIGLVLFTVFINFKYGYRKALPV